MPWASVDSKGQGSERRGVVGNLVYIALGGALGSVARALVGMAVAFPGGTLTVNVLGSFLIGVAFAAGFAERSTLHAFVMLGFLGGFTTFSTFSLDVLKLVQAGQGQAAFGYVLVSVLFSIGACAFGFFVAGRFA
ncbi:MAG: CrcB family protein [Pseudomonadota bacterium]